MDELLLQGSGRVSRRDVRVDETDVVDAPPRLRRPMESRGDDEKASRFGFPFALISSTELADTELSLLRILAVAVFRLPVLYLGRRRGVGVAHQVFLLAFGFVRFRSFVFTPPKSSRKIVH